MNNLIALQLFYQAKVMHLINNTSNNFICLSSLEQFICTWDMSNPANYSPYNKTYKFLLFQNQAYHERNKINAKPSIRTNLRYHQPKKQDLSLTNPESPYKSDGLTGDFNSSNYWDESKISHSKLFSSQSCRGSSPPRLDKSRKVAPKHASFEKFRNKAIQNDNSKFLGRLMETPCLVLKKEKSLKSYNHHLKYREVRSKYNSEGKRKHGLSMGNRELLCPTLKGYNDSGLASQFLQGHMSMVSRSSHASRRKASPRPAV